MNKKSKESFWNSNSRFFGKDIPNKNLFAGILVFAILVLAIVLFVNSPENTVTGNTVVDDFVSLWNDGSDSGENGAGVIKFIFWFIVFAMIYSILSMVSLFNKSITFFLSLFISILSVIYISPSQIYSILLTYTAMGIVLLAFVPFLILVLFSITLMVPFKLRKGKLVMDKKKKARMFQYLLVSMLWIMYAVLIISLAISWETTLSLGIIIALAIAFIFSVVMVIKPSWLAKLAAHSILMSEDDYFKAMRKREKNRLKHIRKMENLRAGLDEDD